MMAGCHSVPHSAVMDDASLNSFKRVLLLLLIRYPGSGIHELWYKEHEKKYNMVVGLGTEFAPSFPREAVRS